MTLSPPPLPAAAGDEYDPLHLCNGQRPAGCRGMKKREIRCGSHSCKQVGPLPQSTHSNLNTGERSRGTEEKINPVHCTYNHIVSLVGMECGRDCPLCVAVPTLEAVAAEVEGCVWAARARTRRGKTVPLPCCASPAFVAKTVPFRAVLRSWSGRRLDAIWRCATERPPPHRRTSSLLKEGAFG